jgi:branched-chain amino acid transport system substrate-binding protein
VWANDVAGAKPVLKVVNDIFKAKYGKDLNGNNARSLQAMLTLAEAINRAGSTDPEAIRKALAATDLSTDQVVMPWAGVKFDAKGQNTKGAGLIRQMKGPSYQTVWPESFRSNKALPELPFKW